MCVVSMVGDHYNDKWKDTDWSKWPQMPGPSSPYPPSISPYPPSLPGIIPPYIPDTVTKEEFNALKREVEEMRELLKRAKACDEQTNQPSCEMEEKVALLKQIAQLVGVDLAEIFGK